MLREDLKDSDIPHRTTVREHIMATWGKHLDELQAEMMVRPFKITVLQISLAMSFQAALGKISFTADVWSDPNLVPFMAMTGHWIQVKTIHMSEGPQHILSLRSELIAFHRLEGRHSGVHLAEAFFGILTRYRITSKACNFDLFFVAGSDRSSVGWLGHS